MTMIIRKSTALRIDREFEDILHLFRKQHFRMRDTFSYSTILYTMEKYWHTQDTISNYGLFDSSLRFQCFEFKNFKNPRYGAKRWRKVERSNANFICLNNIHECQYESFIKTMKTKGLGDPVTAGSNSSYQLHLDHLNNV